MYYARYKNCTIISSSIIMYRTNCMRGTKETLSTAVHFLMVVVKFRNTGQLTSIGEAITPQLLSVVDDLQVHHWEGLESFIRKKQGICHFILDRLDVYAGINCSKRSRKRERKKNQYCQCHLLGGISRVSSPCNNTPSPRELLQSR